MKPNQSMKIESVQQNAPEKPFPFLQLPGELRNMVYSFASEQAEADAVMPIIKKPQAKETKQTENKSFALLRVSKQVRAEYYHYIHGAVHGTIYWSRHHGYMEARCPWGLAFKRTKTAMQISRTLQDYGHMFQLVRHLDLQGSGAAALVLDLVDYDEEKLDGSNICEERADRKRVFLRDLRLVMQDVESITVYADDSQTALLRKQATGWECRLEMLTVFPKLKRIRMQNGTCVEVLV